MAEKPDPGLLGIDDTEWQLLVGVPIVGWRAWQVRPDDLDHLRSVHQAAIWPHAQPLDAECGDAGSQKTNPHIAPARAGLTIACSSALPCGIYACTTPEKLGSWVNGVNGNSWVVTGTVALWGRIVIHEHGWRAQHAYPVELEVRRAGAGSAVDPDEIASGLHDGYGVPVSVRCDLAPRALPYY